jgi:recombination protein RecA
VAKSKDKEEKEIEKSSDVKEILKSIRKTHGEIVKTGSEILSFKRSLKTMSISPMFDVALKGGVREGTWLMISGDPKSGKTTTLMQLAYNFQKEGRPVIYINSEGRLSEMNFEVEGLDPSKMVIITAEDKPLPAETYLDIALQLISTKEYQGALCIIDSISSLIAKRDLVADVSGEIRSGLPKLLSDFVKKAGQIVPNNKIVMAIVTHIISNTSGFGAPKMADGGVKIRFQSDTRIEVVKVTPWETADKKRIGQAVTWKIYYSSLGATGVECTSWIRYGKGIDSIQEIMMLGEDCGLIDLAGSWYTCDFLRNDPSFNTLFPNENPEKFGKFQGQDKVYQFLKENPKVFDLLLQKVKELN